MSSNPPPQYGKETLYDIGTWLRHRYGKLLGKLYYPEKVHAQSTGVSRTQMSIELVLAALYPPEGTVQEWNHDLNWQPIPFFSEPLDQDTVGLVGCWWRVVWFYFFVCGF